MWLLVVLNTPFLIPAGFGMFSFYQPINLIAVLLCSYVLWLSRKNKQEKISLIWKGDINLSPFLFLENLVPLLVWKT